MTMQRWKDRALVLVARVRATRVVRALTHFGQRGGSVLSGGIAYAALFSLAAALTIAFTVGLAVLGGNTELRDAFLDQLAGWLPGLVGDGGALQPDNLKLTVGPGIAGLVAAGAFVWSASAFMGALGAGLRAMLDKGTPRGRALPGLVRTWAGFLGLGLALVTSTVATVVATRLTSFAGQWATHAAGYVVSFLVDGATFVFIVLVVAGARPPRRDLLAGAAAVAVAFGVLRFLGVGVVASSASTNALLAPFAVLGTLLVWINLLARVTLLVVAWIVDPKIEVPLPGGNAGGAVRVGDTVRRPAGPWTRAVHELLRHLEGVGLEAVPRAVGRDALGREVLTYLPGDPVDLATTTPAQLRSAAVWLGRYHRAVEHYRPGVRHWRFVERAPEAREIVCHNDATLYNMLFDGDDVVGVVDWDVAGPGLPVDDVAMLAWSGLPLYEERPDAEVLDRLEQLVEGYAEGLAAPRLVGPREGPDRSNRPSLLDRLLGRGPLLRPVTRREVLEHVVPRMTAATDRIAVAQEDGDEGMLKLRDVGEPERTRSQLAHYRDDRLPALLSAIPIPTR